MQIIVRGNGLHKSETSALDQIQKALRPSWFGYASVLVTDARGSMEFDLIIVTHDRVLLIELKEWNGKLTSYDGNWIITTKRGEQNRGKSPYHRKRDQGYRLADILRTELAHHLGYAPYVEAHVVLCGSATPEHLSKTERLFVHTLEDFLKIGGSEYDKYVQNAKLPQFSEQGKSRPNKNQAHFDRFFRGSRVELAEFKYLEYTAAAVPDRVHDRHLFNEYPATKAGPPVSKAMMRRWDLAALGLAYHDEETWHRIVKREDFVFRTASEANSPLEEYLLRPVSPMVEDNITQDCVELFELRRNTLRLEQHINLHGHKWSVDDRMDLTKAVLAPFAEMHSMGFAHRDISTQNLWYSQDSRIVMASSLHAAFIPEKGTVKDLAEHLKSGSTQLPEDVYASDGEILSPFAKDVYLLALVAHKICFHGAKFVMDDGIPVWRSIESDPFDGKLNDFFAKAMDLEQRNRFANASEMLSEFNTLAIGKPLQYDDTQEVMQQIFKGSFIHTEWQPYLLTNHFPPATGYAPSASPERVAYRCMIDGVDCLLKFWPKAVVNIGNPGINRRILRMRKRIEQTQSGELPLPILVNYGMFSEGNGLFVVTRFEEGQSWSAYIAGLDHLEKKLEAAAALCDLLVKVHDRDFAHGDLHPSNILVRTHLPDDPLSLILIDALDFGDASDPFNVEYGPSNPASTDSFGRDCYAVYKMVEELLGEAPPKNLADEFVLAREQPNGIPVALDPLKESIKVALDGLKKPQTPEIQPLTFSADHYLIPTKGTMLYEGESPCYLHISPADRDPEHMFVRITAQDRRLSFQFDPQTKRLSSPYLAECSFSDYISAGQRALTSFTQPIFLQRGSPTRETEDAFVNFLLSLEGVSNFLTKTDEIADNECTASADQTITPASIWRSMLDTEGDQLRRIEVESANHEESPSGALLISVVAQNGRELEFNEDDGDIGIYLEGETRPFGEVVVEECNSTLLAVRMITTGIRSVKQKLIVGATLIVESKLNNASRERRKKAMERVLSGSSRILRLPDYFDLDGEFRSKVIGKVPTEAAIRARYDTEFEQLNPRQIVAFQRAVSEGPVAVLQGPPGTGKTAFVTKLIHYLFENELAGNILLVGQSHASVDTVAIKARELCSALNTEVSIVRLGNEAAIDDSMLQCHSSSIQRQIRFKFQREYEKRINALSSRLMLTQELVEELAKLHRSISPILDRLLSYTKQLGEITIKHEPNEEVRREKIQTCNSTITSCVLSIQQHMDSRGYDFKLPSPDSLNFWTELSAQVARRHGVSDQLALQRLNNLIEISQDWVDVLGSGSASYDKFLVKTSQLVCGTLVGIGAGGIHIDEMVFDWVIVDEAGRAQASELMIAMQCGRRVLLVGDHKQLAPMYERNHVREVARKLQIDEREVVKTDFERAFLVNDGIALDTQYRMIEPIGNIISYCFYEGELHSFRKEAEPWCSELPYPLNKPVSWIDSGSGERAVYEDEPQKGKFVNKHEVAICLHLLKQLAQPVHIEKLNAKRTAMNPQPIGLITMYQGQKRLIEEELSRAEWAAPLRDAVRIDTVDSYQGSENSLLILSLVRNNERGLQGFLIDRSRINVALSRAKDRLVIIGAKQMWSGTNAPSALGSVFNYVSQQHTSSPDTYEIVDGTTVIEGTRNE